MSIYPMLSDVRYALRQALKAPGFSCIAILILGLGIGVSIAGFTLFNAILLRSLPVYEPAKLVLVSNGLSHFGGERFSYPTYELLQDQTHSLAGLSASTRDSTFLVASGLGQRSSIPVTYTAVSGNYFLVLGVPPFLGRTLLPDDDRKENPRAIAILSYAFWRRNLGGDQGVVGKTILLQNIPFEIAGIAQPGFFGFEPGA